MGIYIHIPFCRKKCFYCGFYSVTASELKDAYIKAVNREIDLRKDYLRKRDAETLYWGGGTPSSLEGKQLEELMKKVESTWALTEDAERSIELNPEDASLEKYTVLADLKFNRLSIGVQSFDDAVLKCINRQHTGRQAVEAIEKAAEKGFENIGIDLILGLPGSDRQQLENDLMWINRLPICHVSVYILSIDSNSVFDKWSQKGKLHLPDEDSVAESYLFVCHRLKEIGFQHYEISNFARNQKYSRHNTAYWQQKEYIGLGTSAHSYDIHSRQWNIAQIKTYIDSLNENKLVFEKEELSAVDKYNEYIMTRLRTCWGAEEAVLEAGAPETWDKVQPLVDSYVENDLMLRRNGKVRLTEKGWLVSDRIFSSLFK